MRYLTSIGVYLKSRNFRGKVFRFSGTGVGGRGTGDGGSDRATGEALAEDKKVLGRYGTGDPRRGSSDGRSPSSRWAKCLSIFALID